MLRRSTTERRFFKRREPRGAVQLTTRSFLQPTRALFLLALLSLSAISQAARSPQKVSAQADASPYTRTLWRTSDGLPEDTVQALLEAANGSLWIGTTGGLASFDGLHVLPYGPSLAQTMGVNSVFCLLLDRDGSLWAGTEGGGLLRLRGGRSEVFAAPQGLTDSFVRTILQDHSGALWVGTDNGLFRLAGNRFQRMDGTREFPDISVHSLMEDSAGRLWVGGSRLVALEPGGALHEFTLPGAYSENRVKKILQTRDGTIWVGTVGGLQHFQNDRFQKLPGISATVRSLLQTSDGTLWIGTIGDGLWRLRNDRLFRLAQPGLLPSETVLSILEDRHRQIWMGTQAGLVRLNQTPVTVIPLPRSGDPDFETISPGPDGQVWVGAQKLYVLRDGVARQTALPGLGKVSIRNTFHARDGSLWVGTDGSGVYRIAGGRLQHFSAPADLTNNFIRAFLETRAGDIWVGTDEGVNRFGKAGITQFTERSGLAYFSTRCLLEDNEGAVWIGTDRGVSRWFQGGFVHNAATEALQHEKVWSLLQDEQGVLWFGTRDHGIFRYQGGTGNTVKQFTTDQGLPVNSIYQMLEDRQGRFWLSGADTIAALRAADLQGPTSGRPPSVQVYTMPFGSDDAQLYGGRQPAGFIAADGSAWFPTSRGAAHVSPAMSVDAGPPPLAVVNGVLVDGRTEPAGQSASFGAHVFRLSFPFSTIYLRSQKDVRFRYRLEGFDRDWTATDQPGAATYTNLPAGHYRFRLQVFEASQPQNLTEADVAFAKAPLVYQTGWFYVLCGLALAALVWAIYWLRLRQLKTSFAAVLSERTRLAREMHDTVIQGCAGISALLEAAAVPGSTPDARAELLDYAREQTRLTINEARQAVWNVRHEHEKDVDLIEAVQGIAAQMVREYGLPIHVQTSVAALALHASAAHEVLMTVREAVYNAVQHSRSESIDVSIDASRSDLEIRITDHGVGFLSGDLTRPTDGHFGITGMRERMQRLGGSLQMNARPGSGTTVTLRLRLRSGVGAATGVHA